MVTARYDYFAEISRSRLAGGAFRFVGVSVVRNESDIIEYFVRYNLRHLDALVVIDNGSTDSTRAILQRLAAERLPLVVLADERVGHFQAQRLTGLARSCVRCLETAYIVPLDADEIIGAGDRDAFRRAIEVVPADAAPLLLWRTYVPVPDDDASIRDPVRRIVHRRRRERRDLGKVLVRPAMLEREDVLLREGNHGLASPDNSIVHAIVEDVPIAHFPVRSEAQFLSKALTSHLAIQLNPERVNGGAFHWKAMVERVADTWEISPEALREIGSGYSDHESSDLVRDPLPVAAAPRWRYEDMAAADPAARITGFLAAVIRQHPVFSDEETPRVLEVLGALGLASPALREIWCRVAEFCAAEDRSADNARLPDIRRAAPA